MSDAGDTESWEYKGGTFSSTSNWRECGGRKPAELEGKIAGVNYVTCKTTGNIAAKTVTVTGLTSLTTGIRLLIKMNYGVITENVTLNINNLGPKTLYYNNEIASINNAWSEGEIIDVYYDGTNFYSCNFQGADGSYMILEWDTNVSTTRIKVPLSKRKPGFIIAYKKNNEVWITEQYVGTNLYDTYWKADENWSGNISSYYTFLVDNVSTLPENTYFSVSSKEVGTVIDIQNITSTLVSSWVGIWGGLHAGCYISCSKYNNSQGLIVIDPQTMAVIYKSKESESFYYKAEKYCYVVFSTIKGYSNTKEIFTDDSSFIPSIEELYKNLLQLSTLTADITYRINTSDAPYQGNTYFPTADCQEGDTFILETSHFDSSIKGGWGSIVIPINANETIKFNKIKNSGQGIIAIDRYSFEVLALIDKSSTSYTASYTAETDVYIIATFIIAEGTYFEVSNVTYAIFKSLSLSLDYEQNKDNFAIKDNDEELINMPANIDVPNGIGVELFAESIISKDLSNKEKLTFYYVNSSMNFSVLGNHLKIKNPTANDVLNIKRYEYRDINGGNPYKEASSDIRVVNRTGGDGSVKNILIIGDSLIEGGRTTPAGIVYSLLADDADYQINQIGLYQKSYNDVLYKHEGHGGWSWETFTNPIYETTESAGKTNPFMHNGVLDFKNYMSVHFSELPQQLDYAIISLGTNDVGQGNLTKSDSQLLEIIEKAKIFIDALLADFPSCKIGIGLPGIGYQKDDVFKAQRFKLLIMKLNALYIETFDNGKYNSNVTCIMHGAWADPENSYITEEQQIGGYIDATAKVCLDRIHPDISGYECWGLAYYAKIRAWMQGLL